MTIARPGFENGTFEAALLTESLPEKVWKFKTIKEIKLGTPLDTHWYLIDFFMGRLANFEKN